MRAKTKNLVFAVTAVAALSLTFTYFMHARVLQNGIVDNGGSCVRTWKALADTNSVGAEQHRRFKTQQECLDACGGSVKHCVAADIQLRPFQCWLYIIPNGDIPTNHYRSPGVTHYIPQQLCTQSQTIDSRCPVWENHTNSNSVNAQLRVGFHTLEACLQGCLHHFPDCVAVDVTSPPVECWVHTNKLGKPPADRYRSDNTNQYRLIKRCPGSAVKAENGDRSQVKSEIDKQASERRANRVTVDTRVQLPGIQVTRAPVLHATVDAGLLAECPVWEIENDKHAVGGTLYEEHTTDQSCLDFCVHRAIHCVAVDIVAKPFECWIHTSQTGEQLNTGTEIGVTHHRLLEACQKWKKSKTAPDIASACPLWDVDNDSHSIGGTFYNEYKSDDSCLDACMNDVADCVAADITKNSFQCWLHTNPTGEQPHIEPELDTAHHRLDKRCIAAKKNSPKKTKEVQIAQTAAMKQEVSLSTVENVPMSEDVSLSTDVRCPLYDMEHGFQSVGGTLHSEYKTDLACMEGCMTDVTNCVAIDITENPFQCWLHTSPTGQQPEVLEEPGTMHYKLDKRCLAAKKKSPKNIKKETTTKKEEFTCPIWDVDNDSQSVGGTFHSEYTSTNSCMDGCMNDVANCVAVDITGHPAQCWVHTSPTGEQPDVQEAPGTIHHKLDKRCIGAKKSSTNTKKAATCIPRWSTSNDTSSLGAVMQPEYTTLKECLSACVKVFKDCVAVDFNNQSLPTQCWIHKDDSGAVFNKQLHRNPGVKQLRLIKRCPQNG